MATEHTRLTYMTTGVLLQKLVQAKCLTEYSHIFVDEVHKRGRFIYLFVKIIFAVLYEAAPTAHFQSFLGSMAFYGFITDSWLFVPFSHLTSLLCLRFMNALRRWTLSF